MLVDEFHTMFDKKSRKQKNRGQITWARKGASIVRQRKHTGDEEEESVPKALLLSPEKSVFLYPNFFCPPNSWWCRPPSFFLSPPQKKKNSWSQEQQSNSFPGWKVSPHFFPTHHRLRRNKHSFFLTYGNLECEEVTHPLLPDVIIFTLSLPPLIPPLPRLINPVSISGYTYCMGRGENYEGFFFSFLWQISSGRGRKVLKTANLFRQ